MRAISGFPALLVGLWLMSAGPVHAQNGLHLWGQLDQKHGTTSGVSYSGLWGYVAPDGREYAIVGTASGTQIIDITKRDSIREIGHIVGPTSIWREMRTWKDRAYVVSEGGSGVQILNLANLPSSVNLIRSFNHTSGTKNIVRNHTIEIFDGYMYLNGSANWSPGGVLIFSLANPDTPVFVGEYQQEYAHDSYVRGNRLYAAAINSGGLNIADISSKSAPTHIGKITYAGAGTHNAWTSTDGNYVFTTDEIGSTPKTLKIWNVASVPPVPASATATYAFTPNDIVHNVTVRGRYAYIAWYTAGTVVVDMRTPQSPATAGFYDSSSEPPGNYDGVWAVYPYFWSGKIIGGDMQNGLYIFTFDSLKARTPVGLLNPANGSPVCDAPAVDFRWSRAADPAEDPHTYTLTVEGPGLDTTFLVGSDTSFTFTGSLSGGQYVWYVTTLDEVTMMATRDTFSFQKSTRILGLDSPDGGNLLKAGAEALITWSESCNDSLYLEYSTNDGATWQPIGTVPAVPPSYAWTVPHEVTTRGLIRITSTQDPGFADTSTSTFEIFESPSVALLSPSEGDVWFSGSTHTISWAHQVVTDLAIDYSTDGGISWINVVADTPAALSSYEWNVPLTGTPDARVRIRSVSDSSVVSISGHLVLPLASLALSGGWNLASFPAHPLNVHTAWNFPDALTQSIYYADGYGAGDSIRNGLGFWIKYALPHTEYVFGLPAAAETVDVRNRWNILGSVLQPLPVASIHTVPPSPGVTGFFGYDPENGFQSADTIMPGKGYWIKADSASQVILSPDAPPVVGGKTPARIFDQLDRIVVSDATGNRQRLYAGELPEADARELPSELPPGPEGMFSARFTSNALIARNGETGPADELLVSNASFPLKILLERSSRTYELVERHAGHPDVVHVLKEGESALLQSGCSGGVMLRVVSDKVAVPGSYDLRQNFPNPFNPTTSIQYDLPVAGIVSLRVFNVLGQEVATLVQEFQEPGSKTVLFDAGHLPNGTYYCRLTSGSVSMMRKMIFMK